MSCCLTKKSCVNLALALASTSSQLSNLNLSFNDFGDEGLIELCKALGSPHCKLQALTYVLTLHSAAFISISIIYFTLKKKKSLHFEVGKIFVFDLKCRWL